MKKNKEVSVEKLLGVKTQKSTTKFTQGNKHDKRNRKKTPRRSKNQGSLCVYLLPERRKYVPVGALFLLFCCIVYFKFSHIRLESVWDNVPTVSNTASSNVDFEQAQSVNTVNKEDAAATLVGNFQLHNLHKIELGIDLNEPISMSQADYVERSDSQIDDGERPYQHDFDWYEDYYNSFADEHVKVNPASTDGWILPMLYFDMGPNNLFRLLRQGAVTAYDLNRGITVPVFHRHPRMGDAAKNPFVLPIFDTNYTVDLVWPAGDTIDVGMLKKLLPVQGMREMQVMCNQQIDALIKCGDIDQKRYEGIIHFQRAINMPVQHEFLIPSMAALNPKTCGEACDPNLPPTLDLTPYKCVGLVYGKKCLPDQEKWKMTFAEIARNFLRPTVIRRFSQDFTEKIIGNRPYLFVHWRYESDWLDMCKPSRPKGARERNKEICKLIMGLTYDEGTRSMFVNNLKAKMNEYNLEVVYLASPPNNIDLIRLLNASFPGNFFYMDDVMRFSNKTMGPDFLDNNYKASFVEQEIGFKSTFYLGASLSSWTQTVLTDRIARKNFKHDSVLKVVTNGAPGYPELVFQFPEGDFNFKLIKGKNV